MDLQTCGSVHGFFPHSFISKYSRLQKKEHVISEHQPQNHEGRKRCSSYAIIIIKGSSFLHHYVNKKEERKKREIGKAFERISEKARREPKEN